MFIEQHAAPPELIYMESQFYKHIAPGGNDDTRVG